MGNNFDVPTNVGGGAYASTVNQILDLYDKTAFNVKGSKFGAAGDGEQDDSGPIQSAIDACEAAGGGDVFIPPGTYLLGTRAFYLDDIWTTLDIPSKVRVRGCGEATTLQLAPGVDASVVTFERFGLNVGLFDLTIDGNKDAQVEDGGDGNFCGVYGSAVNFVSIERVRVLNALHEGFYISNAGWGYYANMTARDCDRSGFEVDAVSISDIIGFQAWDCGLTSEGTGPWAGIRVVGGATLGVAAPVRVIGGHSHGCPIGMYGLLARGAQVMGFHSRYSVEGFDTGDGFLLQGCDMMNLSNCVAEFNHRTGFFLNSGSSCDLSNCTGYNNNFNNTEAADGLLINDHFRPKVIGGTYTDRQTVKTQFYGIQETGSTDDGRYVGVDAQGNGVGSILTVGAGSTKTACLE